MFKYPGVPSPRASAHELADFVELMAWRDGNISTTDLSRALGRIEENDYGDGVPEEDAADRDAEEAYIEMEARSQACGGNAGYPFLIGDQGNTLALCPGELNCRQLVYLYLLLATRLNMRDNRKHAEIDGASLFEKLSAGVAEAYLGPRAENMVFGSASGTGGFRKRITDLCCRLGEGNGARDAVFSKKKDGRLGRRRMETVCRFVARQAHDLRPVQDRNGVRRYADASSTGWLLQEMAAGYARGPPCARVFVSEALLRSGASARCQWYEHSTDAGLLFDRCRTVDFCDGVTDDVLEEVRTWTEAAAENNELPAP